MLRFHDRLMVWLTEFINVCKHSSAPSILRRITIIWPWPYSSFNANYRTYSYFYFRYNVLLRGTDSIICAHIYISPLKIKTFFPHWFWMFCPTCCAGGTYCWCISDINLRRKARIVLTGSVFLRNIHQRLSLTSDPSKETNGKCDNVCFIQDFKHCPLSRDNTWIIFKPRRVLIEWSKSQCAGLRNYINITKCIASGSHWL